MKDKVTSNDEQIISVDDAIEAIGCGKFQLRILLAAGLCFSADGILMLLLSFLSPLLMDE